MEDLYKILEIERNSSPEEIKSAYRKLSKKYHPDVKDTGNEDKFKEINNAYETLSDPNKKQIYDSGGTNNRFQSHGFNMEDIFSNFGNIFGNQFNRKSRKGADLRVQISVSIDDIIFGCDKKIKYTKNIACRECDSKGGTDIRNCTVCHGTGNRSVFQNTPFGRMTQSVSCNNCNSTGKIAYNKCKKCHGGGTTPSEETVDIKLPAGIVNGMQLSMEGHGNSIIDGLSGDLIVIINEIEDIKYKRKGRDIYCEEWIEISDAVLGTEFKIQTPHGEVNLKINPGCESGKIFSFRNKGIPEINTNLYGQLLVCVQVRIPKNISSKERDLFLKLKKN